ncbi:TIGR03986 family type III CRISPR-associated RAMP protein [Saprospira grandis]|uniref:TIGR03986 family type III CRISPR-associated RAMP protein n=1 Tax=Saprospira grandis TaxID=1008 RepID=UPI0022DD70DF|nr:TIGR03986 family CRISPR-associated RAMP protein [Saprospira grandis]WBM74938.1 TIGR03986 family CRISPR-associated RAMP protein [Saprospira grandis]
MSTIKAAYNFVPLNRKVYYPDWSPYISQDQPFSDGQSGFIEIEVESRTPIFIADGQLGQRTANSPLSFSNYNGRHLIPATSFKGMLRSVVEIMSYSKLGVFNQHQFAFRDLNNKQLYMNQIRQENRPIQAGWLKKDGEDYYITPCGEPGRISFANIDDLFGTDMVEYFVAGRTKNRLYDRNNDSHKAARFKYENFSQTGAAKTTHTFVPAGKGYALGGNNDPRGMNGVLVFTGQPGLRKESKGQRSTGKGKEFIFFDQGRSRVLVDRKVIKSFKQAYFDHDVDRQTEDWKHWSAVLEGKGVEKGKIPVFYNVNRAGEIIHMGISYLYKLPYKYDVAALDTTDSLANLGKFDLAECIFGWVPNLTEDAAQYQEIKGRVQVGHLWHEGDLKRYYKNIRTVLSSPKASYYPTYLEQDLNTNGKLKRGVYATYDDSKARLAGRKRYPLKEFVAASMKSEDKNDNIDTLFNPLDTGNKFKGRIYYHNLRLVELGAILSALTFHNSQGEYFHQIGMGKPLGLGAIKVSARLEAGQEQALAAMRSFESCMRQVDDKWLYSEPIKELLTMAKFTDIRSNELEYMKLGRGSEDNEFTKAKNAKEGLNRYSVIADEFDELESLGEGVVPLGLEQRREKLLAELRRKKEQLGVHINQLELEADRLEKEAEEKKRLAIKREQAASQGLDPVKGETEFGPIRSKVNLFLKGLEVDLLPEEYWEELKQALIHAYSNAESSKEKNSFMNRKKKAKQTPLCRELSNWLGDSNTAENWAKEILGLSK